MPKLRRVTSAVTEFSGWMFWCPGCDEAHCFDSRWQFNGDQESPTFSPSLVVHANSPGVDRCHLYVRDGQIQFLSDCEHALAGRTVDMEAGDW